MRETKFRAWVVPAEGHSQTYPCMGQVTGIAFGEHVYIERVSVFAQHKFPWHAANLMQYTGLKDKNGVEIYEGDVVRVWELWVNKKSQETVEENDSYCEVCFVNYQWELIEFHINENGVKMPGRSHDLSDYRDFSFGFCIWKHNNNFECETRYTHPEVIGNIYETPELVEVK